MADILILTGPPGSGKSAVAEALGERYDRVAHVEAEVLRRFITPTGFAKPHQPERAHQYRLGVRNACALARNFIEERFGVQVHFELGAVVNRISFQVGSESIWTALPVLLQLGVSFLYEP